MPNRGWQVGASDARGREAGWVSLTFDLKGLLPLGRTDAEGEAPIFWPSDAKSRLIGEDPDSGKD